MDMIRHDDECVEPVHFSGGVAIYQRIYYHLGDCWIGEPSRPKLKAV
jgi:hypothetical protein